VTHVTSRTGHSPSGRSAPVSERETVCFGQVSWFGWDGRFPVPAMRAFRVGGPSGSGSAEGDRPGRREASLNRMARPRDHGVTRAATKSVSAGEKVLDPEHSRLERDDLLAFSQVQFGDRDRIHPRRSVFIRCWTDDRVDRRVWKPNKRRNLRQRVDADPDKAPTRGIQKAHRETFPMVGTLLVAG
jgi:hypothetical protein